MEKNQIIILEDRGLVAVDGSDAKDFLQNIISNDIEKVRESNSIFSGIFTPQGKYLYEFFIIKNNDGYFLDFKDREILVNNKKVKLLSNLSYLKT